MSKSGEAVAYGKVNFSQKDLQQKLQLKSEGKRVMLPNEVIHRDHLVVLNNS